MVDVLRAEEDATPGLQSDTASRFWRTLVGASLLGAMCLGGWMRWALAGAVDLPLPFANLRHTHSHLGYFGLLFPLAWLGWRAAGVRVPTRGLVWLYAVFTAIACLGFVVGGYGVVAIAGSTAVAGVWLWSVWPLLPRMRRLHDPLGAVPLGLLLSLACVPPIALTLRSDPELTHGLVSTFLSGLLLLVVLPSTLAARRISPGPWPLLLIFGSLGCLFLGVAANPLTRFGLAAYAGLMIWPARAPGLRADLRTVWALVALGLASMAFGLLPNVRSVALGAIHFLILGPVLSTLAPLWLRRPVPAPLWWCGHALWGAMSLALVAQAFGAGPWTWTVAAAGGTGTLLWWVGVLVFDTGEG